MYGLIALLIGVTGFALVMGGPVKRRVALTLLCAWIACTALILGSGIADAWYWFMAVDVVAATVILWPPAGRWQAVIGMTYAGQIVAHGAYGMHGLTLGAYLGWLDLLFVGQLIFLGGWSGADLIKSIDRRINVRRDPVAGPAHRKSMEGKRK